MANVLEIKQGDTPTIRLAAKDANKAAINISNYVSASIKIAKALNIINANASYYELVLAANFSDPVNGIHDFVIPEDTTKGLEVGDYFYQIRLLDTGDVVSSSDVGDLKVVQNLIDNQA